MKNKIKQTILSICEGIDNDTSYGYSYKKSINHFTKNIKLNYNINNKKDIINIINIVNYNYRKELKNENITNNT